MFRRGLPINPKLLGLLVIGVSVASLAFAFVSHKGLPGRSYSYATLSFERVPPSLRDGTEVRVRGQRVGQVHHVSFDNGPRVELQLPGGFDIYKDATARIRSRSLLGQKYVQIDPGTPAAGKLGDAVLGADRTTTVVDIVDLVDTFDDETRKALHTALLAAGTGAAGRGPDINDLIAASPDLLADLNLTGRTLTAEETQLVAFLATAERLSGRFNGREAELERLIHQMGDTLLAVATDDGRPLAETVKKLPSTLDALTPALSDLGKAAAALGPAVEDLGPSAATLGAVALHDSDFRGALRESVPVLGKVPPVSGLAGPALFALTETFNDARPLAPALGRTFEEAAAQLAILAPYAPELDLLLDGLRDAFAEGDANGKYLRVASIFAAINQAGNRNPYPDPGEAATDGSRYTPVGSP
jgi:phospholipid/cholesterol/gamma-HCH transport system substrate-binding protein